jgi:hypothetical protein
LDRRLGGPQSRSGRGGEEKNSQPLPGIEYNTDLLIHNQILDRRKGSRMVFERMLAVYGGITPLE